MRAIYDVNYAYVTEMIIIKNAHYNEKQEDPIFLNGENYESLPFSCNSYFNIIIPILFQKVYSHLYIKHKNTTNLQSTAYIKVIYQKIAFNPNPYNIQFIDSTRSSS